MVIFIIYPKLFAGVVQSVVKCRGLNLNALMPSTKILINTTKGEDRGIRKICVEKVTTKSRLRYFAFI